MYFFHKLSFYPILFSLSDQKPVDNEDEVVVMVCLDYQVLEYVEKIAYTFLDIREKSNLKPFELRNKLFRPCYCLELHIGIG